jgi:peptidyl-prolyl cis-trans isomerase A (cyclophilin A)
MSQLAGRNCVICDERIVVAAEAEFCDSCGNSVHHQCLVDYEGDTVEGRCPNCGGMQQTAPVVTRTKRAMHLEQWLYILVAVVMVGVVLLAWPSGESGEADSGDDEAADNRDEEVVLPIVEIETSHGVIRAQLFTERAPETVKNFIDLVEQEYFDDMLFHRVIRGFMSQTGDPTGTGYGGRSDKGLPPKLLRDEFHPDLRHDRGGLLSMANSGPNSGDSQFFITSGEAPRLDNKHSIFGEVVAGMDVVTSINSVETTGDDRPTTDVKLIKVRVKK